MKKAFFFLLLISLQFSFGQNRFKPSANNLHSNDHVVFNKKSKTLTNMSVIDYSRVPNSDKDSFYLVEVKNTSKTIKNFNITSESFKCDEQKEYADIDLSFYDNSKTTQINNLVVQPGKTKTFYVKTTVPRNTKLSTWNCSNILITNPITNEIEKMKLVVPVLDPKNIN